MFIRRENGQIVAASENRQADITHEIADDDDELLAFLNPLPAITSVSSRQFKLQLLSAGLLDAVDAWVAQQSREVRIAYEYSGTFVKDSPMMLAGFAAMGFTALQIDEFFAAAAQL
ncbi:hypothetical protein [Rhizobium croatiense]|uniref:hypothetical protein n=1 Tax=Rhizobium croatiense TaxID=2867516 RepID=UPI0023EE0E82|nr:hypothetical protein [Rhizobium croatiense]WET74107.1 hypothetical protein PYR68_00775 [Rhizobium croatiense]